MGRIEHVAVDSATHLLQILKLHHFESFQVEFADLNRDTLTFFNEDWSTEPELLEVFYCYIRSKRPHTVVEIGTFKGTSAGVFAAALECNGYGHVYTIDNNKSGVLAEAQGTFSKRQLDHRITLIAKSSQRAFVDWGRAKIDFLYIDGSHTFLDTCSDIALWSRYVVGDGVIAIHDTVTRLLRRFPEDYLHPLCYYDVLNVFDMKERPSGQEWEGCGFVTVAATTAEDR